MNSFLKGLFLGTAVGMLVAPMAGAELRQQLQQRFKAISNSLSENEQFQQFSQQATQTVQTLSQSVAATASQMSNAASQTASPVETIKQAASAVQQQAQNVTSAVQQQAQNATSSVRTAATEKLAAIKPLNTLVQNIQGPNPEIKTQLEAQGIHTTADLLERTATQKQRAELAQILGVSASQLKSYAIQADLMRVNGINTVTAQLLESAGVTGSADLQKRNPEHLHNHLEEMEAATPSGQKIPTIEQLTKQIASAQEF